MNRPDSLIATSDNNRLVLDKETHRYFLDGKPIPGANEIMQAEGLSVDFSAINPGLLENNRAFGSAIHRICELYDKNDLDMKSVSEYALPYLESWKKFLADNKVEIVENEKMVFNENYSFAGTLDRVIKMNGMYFVLDIKSGTGKYPVQTIVTAGYRFAYNSLTGKSIKKSFILHLTATGPKMGLQEQPSNLGVFLAAAVLHNHKRRNGLWKPQS